MIKKLIKSKTLIFGHIQVLLGSLLAGLELINPGIIITALGGASPWALVIVPIGYAGVTYWLRSVTSKPLREK